MKKTITNVISELETLQKSQILNNNTALISVGDVTYTIDDVLCILRDDHSDNDLYKAVKEGIFYL